MAKKGRPFTKKQRTRMRRRREIEERQAAKVAKAIARRHNRQERRVDLMLQDCDV